MSVKPRATIECILSIAGRDFDPEECGRAIGIEGGRIWRQRHEHLLYRTDLSNVEWSYSVGPDDIATIDEAVRNLQERLESATKQIAEYASRGGLKTAVVCLVVIHTVPPTYFLSTQAMRWLIELGAEFSMDIIDRRELEPDESA
jgi:hypothetical protein